MFRLFRRFEWPTELRSIVTMSQQVVGDFSQAHHSSAANALGERFTIFQLRQCAALTRPSGIGTQTDTSATIDQVVWKREEAVHRQGRPLTHVLKTLAASRELSYRRTKRRRSIHMLCSRYAKVNPTGVESIDHLRSRRRPSLRHPL